jgi:hypothetical protein
VRQILSARTIVKNGKKLKRRETALLKFHTEEKEKHATTNKKIGIKMLHVPYTDFKISPIRKKREIRALSKPIPMN